MQRIPTYITNIRTIPERDREVIAEFHYPLPATGIEISNEHVLFDKPWPFSFIVGKEFGKDDISQWVRGHGNQWNAPGFLFDKIIELGGSIPDHPH